MKMKKIIYITIVLFAGILFSCEDYLEAPTKSSLDESVIFSTPDLAKGAIDGIKVSFAETYPGKKGIIEPIGFSYELFSPVKDAAKHEDINVLAIIRDQGEDHKIAWISIDNLYGTNKVKFTDQCIVSWNI